MKPFWNSWRRRREISLHAAGVAPEKGLPEVEQRLASSPVCREHHREIKTIAETLANWEQDFAGLEPTPAMQTRWADAVRQSAAESLTREPILKRLPRNLWREILWPNRRAWAGLAAIWLALLAINASLADHSAQIAGLQSGPPSDFMESWEAQSRALAEMTHPATLHPAPANLPAAPAEAPRPRSERQQDWQMA